MAKPMTFDDEPSRCERDYRERGRKRQREPADVQTALHRLRRAAYQLTHWRPGLADPCEHGGTAREHERAARKHAVAATAARAECDAEERAAAELDFRLRDAQLRARLRRLQCRHARHGRPGDLSVAQAKARLRRSLERITLRSVGLKALTAAREHGGPDCLNLIRRHPTYATAIALLAGVATGALITRRKDTETRGRGEGLACSKKVSRWLAFLRCRT